MRLPFRHADLDAAIEDTASALVDAVGEVRREMGAGLVERVYVQCLAEELVRRGIGFQLEVPVPLEYKGQPLGKPLRIDLLVEDAIVVEAKAVEELHTLHFAQLLTYLRLARKPLGFLINFNAVLLAQGIHRKVNTRL